MSRLFTVQEKPSDNTYTKKVQIPQYVPSNYCPKINELCDTTKYIQLCSEISRANISDEQKTFLKLAATRHIVFNYAKIADYYAHADSDMQKLMENSALVIIDIDDAIANGYVKLSANIKKIMEESGQCTYEK